MKISKEVFELLKSAIAKFDTIEQRTAYIQAYRDGKLENCKDVNLRYRWALYHAVQRENDYNLLVICPDEVFYHKKTGGINDAHIDTALRRIVSDLI